MLHTSKKPQCSTKSAVDKNLNARANSANPKTTLTEFSHPPDWGNDFIIEGKAAKSVNGSPSPTPKPNIAIVMGTGPLSREPAKTEPKRGPVQENETIANTRAINITPITPPMSAALSALLAQLVGNVSS